MEPASALLARPLPTLTQKNGTHCVSDSRTVISMTLFHEWTSFKREVNNAIQRVDLTHPVPCTNDNLDQYVVGSKLGLTGRFSKHVCDAVSLACSSAGLPLQFGDRQAGLPSTEVTPDMVLLTADEVRKTIIPIELKTFWTVRLDIAQIGTHWSNLLSLQSYLGQLVEQMRDNHTVYGILSTYRYTVFVKRVEDYRFEMSKPISSTATQPSLRQCIMATAVIAAEDGVYYEPDDFDARKLQTSSGHQASTRASHYRLQSSSNIVAIDSPRMPVTSETIFYGDSGPVAMDSVEVTNTIRSTKTKKVFEVCWHGRLAIAKWWATSQVQKFINEKVTYEMIYETCTGGYPFFASPLAAGEVRCSSKCPDGYILVITKVKGASLERRWAKISANNREFVYNQVRAAIDVFRTVGMAWADPGMHNILFDEDAHGPSVTVVDFEHLQLLEGERLTSRPEMTFIFGGQLVNQRDPSRYSGG